MPESGTSGSVGAPGEQSPGATRHSGFPPSGSLPARLLRAASVFGRLVEAIVELVYSPIRRSSAQVIPAVSSGGGAGTCCRWPAATGQGAKEGYAAQSRASSSGGGRACLMGSGSVGRFSEARMALISS